MYEPGTYDTFTTLEPELAVGDKVRLRGFSAYNSNVEGRTGTVRALRSPYAEGFHITLDKALDDGVSTVSVTRDQIEPFVADEAPADPRFAPGTRVLLHGQSLHGTVVDGYLGTVLEPHNDLEGVRVHLDNPVASMMYGYPPMEHVRIVYVEPGQITVVAGAETLVLAKFARKIIARGALESSKFTGDEPIEVSGCFNGVRVSAQEHQILMRVHDAEMKKIFAAIGGVPSKQEVANDGR